ncbi:MAG TPA: hypothetical protein VFA33_05845 [Bryobacteraceae bacterium]|nr:hypothetical protein [Bryobacteraceae bacterium]
MNYEQMDLFEHRGQIWVPRDQEHMHVSRAGQHLVCCELEARFFCAAPMPEGLPFDVEIQLPHKPVRVQVKTTRRERSPGKYQWYLGGANRWKSDGSRQRRMYDASEVDVFAFVALDIRKIAFFPTPEVPIATLRMELGAAAFAPPDVVGVTLARCITEFKVAA